MDYNYASLLLPVILMLTFTAGTSKAKQSKFTVNLVRIARCLLLDASSLLLDASTITARWVWRSGAEVVCFRC